jgi:hypothetical protein
MVIANNFKGGSKNPSYGHWGDEWGDDAARIFLGQGRKNRDFLGSS